MRKKRDLKTLAKKIIDNYNPETAQDVDETSKEMFGLF